MPETGILETDGAAVLCVIVGISALADTHRMDRGDSGGLNISF
jgi:hypothetical protein